MMLALLFDFTFKTYVQCVRRARSAPTMNIMMMSFLFLQITSEQLLVSSCVSSSYYPQTVSQSEDFWSTETRGIENKRG